MEFNKKAQGHWSPEHVDHASEHGILDDDGAYVINNADASFDSDGNVKRLIRSDYDSCDRYVTYIVQSDGIVQCYLADVSLWDVMEVPQQDIVLDPVGVVKQMLEEVSEGSVLSDTQKEALNNWFCEVKDQIVRKTEQEFKKYSEIPTAAKMYLERFESHM